MTERILVVVTWALTALVWGWLAVIAIDALAGLIDQGIGELFGR